MLICACVERNKTMCIPGSTPSTLGHLVLSRDSLPLTGIEETTSPPIYYFIKLK